MDLTMDGYVQLLEKQRRIVKIGYISEDFPVTDLALGVPDTLNNSVLYLNPGPKIYSRNNILNIVTNSEPPVLPGWYLPCPADGVWDAVNVCLHVWQTFLRWRERCRDQALIEHDLPGLLEVGAAYLSVDMVIIDRDYRYDGGFSSKEESGSDFFGNPEDMDAKAVEDLYVLNPRFDETFETDGLVYYPFTPQHQANIYYYNLRYDRLYLGRLLYRIPEDSDTSGMRHLMERFGALVARCYEFHYLRKNKGMPRYSLYDTWKQLLDGKPVDREATDGKLHAMLWEPGHRYQILHLLSNGYFRSAETLKFYAVQLEQTFPACIAAQIQDGIFVLHNLDREQDPDFRQHLADFPRENLFISGLSNVFHSFYDSGLYGRQAAEALELGIRKNPSLWRHEFRDYQTDYIFQQCLSRYTARDLCPQGLEKLLRHDEEHPEVELVKTLKVYYNCKFNAAEAAKQLFIHRTTLFYRLNKIQQIAAIDHEDPRQRLQLQLCFALLEEQQRRQHHK